MGTSGTLIRLIDVVFILLFGFISISEINEKSQIELPNSSETIPSNPDKQQVVFVGIQSNGVYLLENERKEIRSPVKLYHYLQDKAEDALNNGYDIRVRIRSNFNAPIKYTMAAADICDNLNIQKGIDDILSFGTFRKAASSQRTNQFYQVFLSWWESVK